MNRQTNCHIAYRVGKRFGTIIKRGGDLYHRVLESKLIQIIIGGITYELKYWYKNSSGTGTAISDDEFENGYRPDDTEIELGVVNFYAEYVPTTSNITISKTVKGLFGDRSKEFIFRIDGSLGSGVEVVKNSVVFARGSFTLKHGESVEVKGVPPGDFSRKRRAYGRRF